MATAASSWTPTLPFGLAGLALLQHLAVTATVAGISLQMVGVILMVVGVVGLVLSFVLWTSWGSVWARRRAVVARRVDRREDSVVRDDRYDDIDRAA